MENLNLDKAKKRILSFVKVSNELEFNKCKTLKELVLFMDAEKSMVPYCLHTLNDIFEKCKCECCEFNEKEICNCKTGCWSYWIDKIGLCDKSR
jgi:hypothetical protein